MERPNPANRSTLERKLFSVLGEVAEGRATALIVADDEAAAEYFALNELGFLRVTEAYLASDTVYVRPQSTGR
jgi:hypothetical protein